MRGTAARGLAVSLAVAALSLLLVAPAPSYDPWAWLLWGREVAAGSLSTEEGPAFKPLPVAVCALLAPLGALAPTAWVLLARGAAAVAVWLAFRLGRRLGGGTAAGGLAAAAVALCGSFLASSASGLSEGMLLALALAGAEAWRARRFRAALACGAGCALLRVEAWPFLLAAGVVLWRRRPRDRPLLAACALAVPALWFMPEWLGSGDVLRSGARARIPNPGQPALADVPALASLGEALALPLWALWAGVAALAIRRARDALAPAAVGAAWIALVAAMAQAGFSGEPRYALPGAALVALSGAIGLAGLAWAHVGAAEPRTGAATPRTGAPEPRIGAAEPRTGAAEPRTGAATPRTGAPEPRIGAAEPRTGAAEPRTRAAAPRPPRPLGRAVPVLLALLVAAAALPKLADLPGLRSAQAYQRDLAADLARAVRAAGGREAVLACGSPYVGRYRGPLLAYRLAVEKRAVRFAPRAPGTVFVSRRTRGAPPQPAAPPEFRPVARAGLWRVLRAC